MDTIGNHFDGDPSDLFDEESLFGLDLSILNQTCYDTDIFDDSIPDISLPSAEPPSLPLPDNSLGKVFDDIPLDRNEWLVSDQTSRRPRSPRLYEFLILLLYNTRYATYAYFKDKARGLFEITAPDKVADLWQQVRNRQSHQNMTYDKFARGIRWYYKADIMQKTNTRYTFQFSPKTLAGIFIDETNTITIQSPVCISNTD